MSHVFISYARSTAKEAQAVARALRSLGHEVWLDDEIPAHRAYADVIEERLTAARAVIVIWSAEAVKSQWVQSEADRAREDSKLVQLNLDGAKLPMPFDRIQCADMTGWTGDLDAPGWCKVVESVAVLASGLAAAPAAPSATGGARNAPTPARGLSVCVLPFANMSGDPEQEYFSDGISEDIITDLSKVSALEVCARNTAFTFKGRSVRVPDVARELGVSHVLEGSVRRAGGRVRITAQLIDGATGNHVWAERYDRDLTDIFALQDEISEAIVSALSVKLLPAEKTAIERRGTSDPDAYEIYLMGRQQWLSGDGSVRGQEAILRLARRATEIDPDYAQAWALIAHAQTTLHVRHGRADQDGVVAVERALALDPNLADAHAVKARHLAEAGRAEEAEAEMQEGLRLDPGGFEVNQAAAYMRFRQGRIEDAIRHYEIAAGAPESPIGVEAMLMTCYQAIGDAAGQARAARATLERAKVRLAKDANNTDAIAFGAGAHAMLGDADSARAWVRRAMLVDPDNRVARYNLACALSMLGDRDTMIDLLRPYYASATPAELAHAKVDPDLDILREDLRFIAMLAEADARLVGGPGED